MTDTEFSWPEQWERLPLGREVALLFLSKGTSEAGTPPIRRSEKGQKDSNRRCGRLNTPRLEVCRA